MLLIGDRGKLIKSIFQVLHWNQNIWKTEIKTPVVLPAFKIATVNQQNKKFTK